MSPEGGSQMENLRVMLKAEKVEADILIVNQWKVSFASDGRCIEDAWAPARMNMNRVE